MKKPEFLYATSTALRPLMERAAFDLPQRRSGGIRRCRRRPDRRLLRLERGADRGLLRRLHRRARRLRRDRLGWLARPLHARHPRRVPPGLQRQRGAPPAGAGRPENRQTPERTRPMKLGCICGTFNRSFDSGAMDQIRFLHRCAADLQVQGVELQDIHFPQTRPAYLAMLRRTARELSLSIVAVGATTTSAGPTPRCARARSPRSSSGSRLPSSSARRWSGYSPATPRATARSAGPP